MINDKREPREAKGRIMTEFKCPWCDTTLTIAGNCDGEKIDCAVCDGPVVIRVEGL